MGLRETLARLALDGPVPVFVVAGGGLDHELVRLKLDPRIRLVSTPRSANVMLAMGAPTSRLLRPAARVHDQMSHPRATVWAPGSASIDRITRLFPEIGIVRAPDDPVDHVLATHERLIHGERPSEPDVLPNEEPNPWRGVGPYGQGGKGMTGGVPYGRPLPQRSGDRDGLELDVLDLRVGPFFPHLPAGFEMTVKLQGDIVQEVRIHRPPRAGIRSDLHDPVLQRVAAESVCIAELELARARHHVLGFAGALHFHGLQALGRRVARMATTLSPDSAPTILRLRRLVPTTGVLSWSTKGVGVVSRALAEELRGPNARASGVLRDLRAHDPTYQALGFEPIGREEGDAAARWKQRIDEAIQSVELARRAEGARTTPGLGVEGPRGPIGSPTLTSRDDLSIVTGLIEGMEWGDALTTIVSLDLGPMVQL
ncbi:MAG: hypothetical protein HKN72_01130 [Gemmatimonadetes bacterium]|nr:hypothetical protein [Gemmatimonadota bacterium]